MTQEAVVEAVVGSLEVSKFFGPDKLPAVVLMDCAKELTKSIFGLLSKIRLLVT